MTENNIHPTAPHVAAAPAPVASEQPVQQPASVTATAAAASAVVNSPSLNGGGEQLPCQWVGCSEKSPTAEALYVRFNQPAVIETSNLIFESGTRL